MLFLLLVLFLDYLKQKIKGVIQQTPEMKKWVKQYWLNPHTFIQKVCECLYHNLYGYILDYPYSTEFRWITHIFSHSPSLTWQTNKNYWRTSKGTLMFVSHGTITHHNKKRDWRSYFKIKRHWRLNLCNTVMNLQEVQAPLIFKVSSNLEEDIP